MADELVGRIFVAVDLTDEVRHGLVAHLDAALEGRGLPGRAVVPPNWHLTLRFLGTTERRRYETLLHRLDEAGLGSRFTLGFGQLGAFPRPQRATVLWLGTGAGGEELSAVAGAVENAASDAGFIPEERPFHPHLTLSRIRPHQDVHAVIEAVPPFPLTMAVEEIVVFRSHLRSGPPTYEALERIPLG